MTILALIWGILNKKKAWGAYKLLHLRFKLWILNLPFHERKGNKFYLIVNKEVADSEVHDE